MPVLRLVESYEREPASGGAEADFRQYLLDSGRMPNTVTAYLSDCRTLGLYALSGPQEHRVKAEAEATGRLAPRTRMRRLSSAAVYYDFLLERRDPAVEGQPRNPYRTVRRPRLGVVTPNVVPTPEQSRRFIARLNTLGTPEGRLYAAAVAVMAGSGLRVAEVCALRIGDVDLDRGVIRVEVGKGRKSRDVPLNASVLAEVDAYLRARPDLAVLTKESVLFPRSPRSVQRAVNAVARTENLVGVTPHRFRHGFGTEVYRATRDLRLVGDLLGHASVTTTQIYTHIVDDHRREAVASAL